MEAGCRLSDGSRSIEALHAATDFIRRFGVTFQEVAQKLRILLADLLIVRVARQHLPEQRDCLLFGGKCPLRVAVTDDKRVSSHFVI
jgi:hypothetical protein